eukprot:365219-Chlamydomonas_euryale.AAC.38
MVGDEKMMRDAALMIRGRQGGSGPGCDLFGTGHRGAFAAKYKAAVMGVGFTVTATSWCVMCACCVDYAGFREKCEETYRRAGCLTHPGTASFPVPQELAACDVAAMRCLVSCATWHTCMDPVGRADRSSFPITRCGLVSKYMLHARLQAHAAARFHAHAAPRCQAHAAGLFPCTELLPPSGQSLTSLTSDSRRG